MLQNKDEVFDLSQKTDLQFLNHLMEKGLLNIQSQSIRDMITDENPFYESIHINVISAFMEWDSRSIDLDELVGYLFGQQIYKF